MGSRRRAGRGGQGFGSHQACNASQPAPQEMTARRRFPEQMEQVVPWAELLALLQPCYPQVGSQGVRRPYPLERQLWIRTPGLRGNISVGTTLLEISSPPQSPRKTTFSLTGEIAGFCGALKNANYG